LFTYDFELGGTGYMGGKPGGSPLATGNICDGGGGVVKVFLRYFLTRK